MNEAEPAIVEDSIDESEAPAAPVVPIDPAFAEYVRLRSLDFGENLVEGGEIIFVTNEAFAEAKNLLDPEEPKFNLGDFDPKRGQRFSSWETARHSQTGVESTTIKLPKPSRIGAVMIDTKWHDGNQAQAAQLMVSKDDQAWLPLTMPTSLQGHSMHIQRVEIPGEWQYVSLFMIPDGGIARLRVYENLPPELNSLKPHDMNNPTAEGTLLTLRHPDKIPKPTKEPFVGPDAKSIMRIRHATDFTQPVCLTSINLGARIVAKSDARYSHAENVLKDSEPENMGDAWENARYRLPLAKALGDSYCEIWDHAEWLVIELAERGTIEKLVTGFRYFNFNNPMCMEVEACVLRPGETLEEAQWMTVITKMSVKRFASQANVELPVRTPFEATHLRVKIYPCGGVHRIRAIGKSAHPRLPLDDW